MSTPQPTLAGFTAFVRNVMGISTTVLPDGSPYLSMAFAVALSIVNPALNKVAIPSVDAAGVQLNSGCLTIFVLAVYNLGGDNLINYAQDQSGAAIIPGSVSDRNPNGLPFFAFARYQWNINGFVSGVISETHDESTGSAFVVQEAAKQFTLANIQNLKTPYGRAYLAFAQSYGPSLWGMN